MKLWNFLTGDIDYLTYGGKWYRKINDNTYHIIQVMNWKEVCGNEAPPETYNVDLSEVCLNNIQLESALRYCGYNDGLDEWGDPISDLVKVEALHAAGARAPLDSWDGNNFQKLFRHAKRRSRELDDPDVYESVMNRPVNKIGSTAKEVAEGDFRSAILHGLAEGREDASLMHILMER